METLESDSYAAALLFTLTSAATNAKYGYAKGADLPSALIWLTVSVAASIVFALGVPALLKSLGAKKWAQALLVCIGLAICGTYSIVAALGSASGGRANAAAEEQSVTDRRAKAQAAWESAKRELDALAAAKPGAELQKLIQAARDALEGLPEARSVAEIDARLRVIEKDPRRYGCAPINGSMKVFCPTLSPERARAERREELAAQISKWTAEIGSAGERHAEAQTRAQATMDKAAADLTKAGPAKVANSDAAALSGYLAALGWTVTPDVLNKLLALLAVLVIELGGGASLAIGMALNEKTHVRPDHSEPCGRTATATVPPHAPCTGAATVPPRDPWGGTVPRQPATIKAKQRNLVDTTETALLRTLQDHGGTLSAGRRALGRNLGVSATQVSRVLEKLTAAGIVAVEATRRGSVIRLLVSGTA